MEAIHKITNPQFSSSPGFGTPLHPIPPTQPARAPPPPAFKPTVQSVLPTNLPPQTLRPLAFRTFTKKHNLTLNSSALQALATFIGRHCGSSWREEGTGEKVLEEVAKLWKAESGPVIVDDGTKLKGILRTLEGCMSGGRVGPLKRTGSELSRQSSFAFGNDSAVDLTNDAHRPSLDGRNSSFGMSKLQVEEDVEEPEDSSQDPRAWLKVISAFEQPRMSYDANNKHFSQQTGKPSMFPSPMHKTDLFRERYNVIHQRLLRNENFQAPSISSDSQGTSIRKKDSKPTERQFYKITPIANLLGRAGASFLLLGMLVIAPTGTLAINDGSGSISLDLQHAHTFGEEQSYFCPGMIVLVEGSYEESWAGAGSSGLGNTGGVGGTIGGRFIGFSIGGPPVEKRNVSLGIELQAGEQGGGFGWTDFLGLGSERAVGPRMRRLERRLLGADGELEGGEGRRKMIVLSEVTLDDPSTLTALRKVLSVYAAAEEPPMTFTLMGNFASQAAMAGAGTGSIEYKELFDSLAAVLADFPSLLRSSTWVFVPGDNDPWSSAFSAGASTLIPREGIADIFTSRIKRAFAGAKAEAGIPKQGELDGEAIWSSNPTRLSFFGPLHEVVVFRDEISGRLRRNAVRIGQVSEAEQAAAAQPDGDGDGDLLMSGSLPGQSPSTQEPATIPPQMSRSGDGYNTAQAKKLILTLLPQSTLSPFSLQTRPVHWSYAPSALSLYPLPNTLVLADRETPAFALTYEGCHVLNPGPLVVGRGKVGWVEYDVATRRGTVREEWIGKLELWFPLPISAYYTERVELEKPYMTFSAPSIFFSYLRKRGSKVTELVVHFGARAGWTGMSMFHDHDHVAENSTTFRCELAERDWDAAQERFTTTCLDVRDSTNEWMRAKQGQISPLENSEIADYADFMAVLGRGGRMDVDHSTSEVKFAGAMFNKDAKWAFRTGGLARRPLARGTTTQGLRSRRWRRRISVIAVVTWVSELRMGRSEHGNDRTAADTRIVNFYQTPATYAVVLGLDSPPLSWPGESWLSVFCFRTRGFLLCYKSYQNVVIEYRDQLP